MTELGEFIEKKDAAVTQTYLAGSGHAPSTHQPGMGDGVVRRAKGTLGYKGGIRR